MKKIIIEKGEMPWNEKNGIGFDMLKRYGFADAKDVVINMILDIVEKNDINDSTEDIYELLTEAGYLKKESEKKYSWNRSYYYKFDIEKFKAYYIKERW